MILSQHFVALLSALACAVATPLMATDAGCADLNGKNAAAHLEYLRRDRADVSSNCVIESIRYLGLQHYAEASAVLIQYLDYSDPVVVARRGSILEMYPAIDALYSLHRAVVPELTGAIANDKTTELIREHAAFVLLLLFGGSQPEAIATIVRAAKKEADPAAAIRLMDKARWLAAKCSEANRNECQNAVLR